MTDLKLEVIQKELNTLINKDVFVSGWQYDNSGSLLDGVIVSIEYVGIKTYTPHYKVSTKNNSTELELYVLKQLIEKGVCKANRMLSSGTNAILNPHRIIN